MLAFPQLTTGTLTQYPLLKRHRMRTVINTLGDGNSIKLADPCGEITEWQLQYTDLSDEEASALETFFEATEGGLRPFAFLDPTANLFAWSNRLDHSGWTKGPLLSIAGGFADPMGGTNAWRISNSGGATQRLSQTLEAPGGFVYCLSAYVKGSAAANITLLRGSARADRALTAAWTRIALSASGDPLEETVEFGIEVPVGGSLDLFGLQVEPQVGASTYKASTTGGIYPNAWFRDDTLALTATDVNRHSATVNIIHANRL
jgi:hypothetical protein